jgi:predicted Zn finger-like uncharacterized protein
MDVICDNCKTEYDLDDTLVSSAGTSVRCTSCGHVFRAFKGGGGADQWFLRRPDGTTRTITRLSVLQRWISEGSVSGNDLISKKNGPWKRIADIPELQPFFKKGALSAGVPKTAPGAHQATIRGSAPNGIRKGMDTLDEPFIGDKSIPKAIPMSRPMSRKGDVPRTGKPDMPRNTLNPPPVSFDDAKTTVRPRPEPPRATPESQKKTPVAATVLQVRTPVTATVPQASPVSAPSSDNSSAMGTSATVKVDPEPQKSVDDGFAKTIRPNDSVDRYARDAARDTEVPEDDLDFSQIPAARDDGVRWGRDEKTDDTEPAWAEKNSGILPYDESVSDLPPPRRKTGRFAVALSLVVLVGGGALLFALSPTAAKKMRSAVNSLLGSSESDRFQKFFDRGQENFLFDTDASYRQADREFQKVLALEENHPPTLAALAQMYGVWAQYLKDETLDAEADAAGAEADAAPGISKEVERLRREFEEKRKEALQWATQALAADPELKEAQLAMADVKRLEGRLDEAAAYLKKAEQAGADAETEYVAALIAMDRADEAAAVVDRLKKAIAAKPMIRGVYRKARVLAGAQSIGEAEAALARVFELNPSHDRARKLAERIKAGKPIRTSAMAPPASAPPDTAPPVAKEEAPLKEKEAEAKVAEKPAPAPASEAREPRSVDGMLTKAAKLQSSGNTQGAKVLYEKALDQSPNNVEALTGLGSCHAKSGATGRALAYYRRALSNNPSYGPALIGLGDTYKRSGDKALALRYYQQYLDTNPGGRQAGIARRNVDSLSASPVDGDDDEPTKPEPYRAGGDEASPSQPDTPGGSSASEREDEKVQVIISGPEDEAPSEPASPSEE